MLDLLAGGIWFSKIVAGAMGQEAQRYTLHIGRMLKVEHWDRQRSRR
jgi:hypothetical protein